ncbi:MAG: hypothetical protein QNK04_33555 [Myxococcota bacterium]|nr:hypothetical protein [Myxococcota bacterium]
MSKIHSLTAALLALLLAQAATASHFVTDTYTDTLSHSFTGASTAGGTEAPCREYEAMVGMYGTWNPAIQSLGSICHRVDAEGRWAGSPRYAPLVSNDPVPQESSFERMCPPDQAVYGFDGSTGIQTIQRLKIKCKPIGDDFGLVHGAGQWLPDVGGKPGAGFAATYCVDQRAAKGFRVGVAGPAISSVALGCDYLVPGAPELVLPADDAILGTAHPIFDWSEDATDTVAWWELEVRNEHHLFYTREAYEHVQVEAGAALHVEVALSAGQTQFQLQDELSTDFSAFGVTPDHATIQPGSDREAFSWTVRGCNPRACGEPITRHFGRRERSMGRFGR